jgi:CheY-like chemotaxis protein
MMIGLYLKKADQHLKTHNFEAAEREVSFALSEDPTNIYALAYKERIHRARMEYAEELRQAEERRQQDEIYKQKQHELQQRRLEMALESKQTSGFTGGKLEKVQLVGAEDKYRELLRGAWKFGRVSEKDSGILARAREELAISDEDHARLDKEIKIESYIAAIKNAWRSKKIIPTQPAAFDEFRNQYDVSVQEHTQIEGRLLVELHGQQKKETVMYIDDEVGLTEVVDETLRDSGYKTIIANSPEQAMQHLKNLIPDIIICDVRFPESNVNGLMIYEEVRKMPHFNAVPFIFLSGVSDPQIMYSGLAAGADDYITKPFNTDRLLAVIEGKLKRYKELRNNR